MSRRDRWLVHGTVIILVVVTALLASSSRTRAACHPIEVTWYSPTGVAGCVVYGVGTASTWPGPGAARNDCVYPWRHCQTVRVESLTTGLVIVVTPTMYCDCYTTTARERIIDLDPAMVRALGLELRDGLWPVRVTPVDQIPDTAMKGESDD